MPKNFLVSLSLEPAYCSSSCREWLLTISLQSSYKLGTPTTSVTSAVSWDNFPGIKSQQAKYAWGKGKPLAHTGKLSYLDYMVVYNEMPDTILEATCSLTLRRTPACSLVLTLNTASARGWVALLSFLWMVRESWDSLSFVVCRVHLVWVEFAVSTETDRKTDSCSDVSLTMCLGRTLMPSVLFTV